MTHDGQHEPHEGFDWETLEQLYFEGLPLDEAGRQSLLVNLRAKEEPLVSELEELWQSAPEIHPLIQALPGLSRALWRDFHLEKPPERIGSYQIQGELGRGGMGVVYKAFQDSPLARSVAIKILPTAFLNQTGKARFEVEQRTLSALSHPHIATIYDAGVTKTDQPFLVMEFLEGLTITDYCNHHYLSVADRLQLFIQICEGIHHAHLNLIIHRDIKPSNILVVEKNHRPHIKIIDFGIAGSLQPIDLPKYRQASGTPAYMSPEAAGSHLSEMDTRSDIYSLGALLFELLIGQSPLAESLAQLDSFREQCLLVATQTPDPLTIQVERLITANVASSRSSTPARLRRKLRGEIHWIVDKALARDPKQRYHACTELVADVTRYLNQRPLAAAPDQTWYPVKKWLLTHKLLVIGSLTFLIGLCSALGISLKALAKVKESRQHLQQVHRFSENIFKAVSPYEHGRDVRAFSLLDEASQQLQESYADQPLLEASIQSILANSYFDLGLYSDAEPHYARAQTLLQEAGPAQRMKYFEIINQRAYNALADGDHYSSQTLYELAYQQAQDQLGPNHPSSLALANGLAFVLGRIGQVNKARNLFETTLARQRRVLSVGEPSFLATLNNLAELLITTGQAPEAEKLLEDAYRQYRDQVDAPNPFFATLMHNRAYAYWSLKKYEACLDLCERLLPLREQLLGKHHPDRLSTLSLYASALGDSGAPERAVQLLQDNLKDLPNLARDSPLALRLHHNLGHYLFKSARLAEAEVMLGDTLLRRDIQLPLDHPDTLKTQYTLGEVLWALGRSKEAIDLFKQVVDRSSRSLDESHPLRKQFIQGLNEAISNPGTAGKDGN